MLLKARPQYEDRSHPARLAHRGLIDKCYTFDRLDGYVLIRSSDRDKLRLSIAQADPSGLSSVGTGPALLRLKRFATFDLVNNVFDRVASLVRFRISCSLSH